MEEIKIKRVSESDVEGKTESERESMIKHDLRKKNTARLQTIRGTIS